MPGITVKDSWSDGKLLRAAAEGDDDAFAVFSSRSLPTLRAVIRNYCSTYDLPHDIADDVIQDTLLRTICWLREAQDRSVTLGFLVTSAKRNLIDQARARHYVPVASDPSWLEDAACAKERRKSSEDADRIFDAIERLSGEDRRILEAIYFSGASVEDLAGEMDKSKWTVYKRHQRAIEKLRKIVDESRSPR